MSSSSCDVAPAAGNSEHCWENHVDKELKREAGARPDQGPMTWALLTFEAPIMELVGDIPSQRPNDNFYMNDRGMGPGPMQWMGSALVFYPNM